MPYKDKKKQLASWRNYYSKNKIVLNQKKRKRKTELQNWLKNYKSKLSCEICGESFIPCLHFHHRVNEVKIDNIAKLVNRGLSKNSILKEISKCDILCANCHIKLHNGKSGVEVAQ